VNLEKYLEPREQSPVWPAAKDKPDREIIEITDITTSSPVTPPAPRPLPQVDLVIIFVVNGKEMSERRVVIDVNQNFEGFEDKLTKLVDKQLPNDLTVSSYGVEVVYKQAYVTKSQGVKRKDLGWMEFGDDLDYEGLVNAIRNSSPSKMTLLIRAFITIPKEDFDAQILPIIASQRMVCSYFTIMLSVDRHSPTKRSFGISRTRSTLRRICPPSRTMEMQNPRQQVLLQNARW
jgi:hypothetical protein